VRVYANQGHTGATQCFSASDSNLADNTYSNGTPIDNTISSFILYPQTGCPLLEVHNDASYGGVWCYSTNTGPNNIAAGCAGQVSSILLRPGWSIKVYEKLDQDLTGGTKCLNASDPDLSDNTFSNSAAMDNKILSFQLYSEQNCPTTPVLDVSRTGMNFSATFDGGNPAAKSFTISNGGTGTLSWTASDNVNWLTLSETSGTGSATINVSVNKSGLSVGTYQGKITVSSTGASGSPKTINVTLKVTFDPITPKPQTSCVPYFSQKDKDWQGHPLRTGGNSFICSAGCGTIGACGCTLTSAAMVFKYYGGIIPGGKAMNPPNLSDCMDTNACGFHWGVGVNCTLEKVKYEGQFSRYDINGNIIWTNDSWVDLERQVNQYKRPVILGMQHKTYGNTHWVVVLSGSGSDPANYVIHDPGVSNGANMRLNAYSARWNFQYITVYSGNPPACSAEAIASTQLDPAALSPKTVELTAGAEVVEQAIAPTNVNIAASSVISGAVWVYRMTDITMTIELTADTTVGSVTEALIWSDTISNTTWQSFTPYVYMPVSDYVYAMYRNEFGDQTEVYSASIFPAVGPPGTVEPTRIYLPLIIKQN
jgi:hypothetical protein